MCNRTIASLRYHLAMLRWQWFDWPLVYRSPPGRRETREERLQREHAASLALNEYFRRKPQRKVF